VTPGVWFIIGTLVASGALLVAGGVRAAIATAALAKRASSMNVPDLDFDKARSAVARIQADLDAMTALFTRARAAMASIDAEVRAMIRAFSRG